MRKVSIVLIALVILGISAAVLANDTTHSCTPAEKACCKDCCKDGAACCKDGKSCCGEDKKCCTKDTCCKENCCTPKKTAA